MPLDTRGYYSISETATLLGVNRVTVWRWIRDGRLPASRLGHRTTRIKREDLERLLDQAGPAASRPVVAYEPDAWPPVADRHPPAAESAQRSAQLSAPDDRTPDVLTLQKKVRWLEAEIAERKRTEERLRLALVSRQSASEAAEGVAPLPDEFLSIAGDILKTPLDGLSVRAQLVFRRLAEGGQAEPEQVVQALLAVADQAEELAHLIDQLMEISRLDPGERVLDWQPTDLGVLIERVISDARSSSEQPAITFTVPVLVDASDAPSRLQQVLTNLLDNAIKYGPEDRPIDVVVSQAAPEVVELSVRDRGPEMPPGQRIQIFERFYRAHGQSHKGRVGLGLFISRQIVELHGGEIRAEFPPDGGTRFVVRLPVGLDEPAPLAAGD
ncbi:MAG: ATP-binding protein [Thermomicrobiales bacterium]